VLKGRATGFGAVQARQQRVHERILVHGYNRCWFDPNGRCCCWFCGSACCSP